MAFIFLVYSVNRNMKIPRKLKMQTFLSSLRETVTEEKTVITSNKKEKVCFQGVFFVKIILFVLFTFVALYYRPKIFAIGFLMSY